jgi:tubulin alpha
MKTGTHRGLFKPDLLITGKEDAANNHCKGDYSVEREIVETAKEKIR